MRGPAIVPESHGRGVDEGPGPAFVEFLVKSCAVDDVAEFVDENAFDLHPSFVFHDVFFGEKDDVSAFDFGEESSLPPVVEVEFLAGFVRLEFWKV